MNGVESPMSAARMVRAACGYGGLPPVSGAGQEAINPLKRGALIAARDKVREILASTGYVDLTGPLHVNFQTYLHRGPVEMNMDDLKPGLLPDVTARVAGQLATDPESALETQARVPPEAAIRLIT